MAKVTAFSPVRRGFLSLLCKQLRREQHFRVLIDRALNHLSEKERNLLTRLYLTTCDAAPTMSELSDELGIDIRTLRSSLYAALSRMDALLFG